MKKQLIKIKLNSLYGNHVYYKRRQGNPLKEKRNEKENITLTANKSRNKHTSNV